MSHPRCRLGFVGYRGKVEERVRARALRREGWRLADIAAELQVSKSSVSGWTRDIPVVVRRRPRGPGAPNRLRAAKEAEIERLLAEGRSRVGALDDRDLLIAWIALYAGEGFKRDGAVGMANTDPRILGFFCHWLRACFEIDESRLRVRLYLHEDLDLEAAEVFWSTVTDIPRSQFRRPYRAVADASRRSHKHPMGCPAVTYSSSPVHRAIIGLVDALLPCTDLPG